MEWITGDYHVKLYMTLVGTVAEMVTGPVFAEKYPKARKITKIHSLIGLKILDNIIMLSITTRVTQVNIHGDIRIRKIQ